LTERDFDFEIDDEELEGEEEQPGPATPYAVLGVEPDATSDPVRIAYHRKVREHPPERDPEGFKRVREAYETLRSPRKRAELTLLELRQGPGEFDLDRLRDAPPPPFPARYVNHMLSVALAEVDSALDVEVARAREVKSPDSSPDRPEGNA
jgi:hypothetical protein